MRHFTSRVLASASVWALSSSALRVGGNIAILPLALHTTPPEQMGFWYFLIALTLFVNLLELGFSPVLARSVTYLWNGAPRLRVEGLAERVADVDSDASNREFSRVYSVMIRVAFVVAIFAFGILLAAFPLVRRFIGANLPLSIMLPIWGLFASAASMGLVNFFLAAFLSGVNAVTAQHRVITLSLLLNYAIVFIGLNFGAGIYALVMGTVVMTGVQLALFGVFFRTAVGARLRSFSPSREDYLDVIRVLWPNARRGFSLNVATFFILNTGTLLCSALVGLVTTASYGLTNQILMALATMSMVLIQIKLPVFSALRTAGDIGQLRSLFIQRIRISLLIFIAGAVGLAVFGPLGLDIIHSQTTLLSRPLLLLLALFILLQLNHSFYELLVLSENLNPFAPSYLAAGAAVAVISAVLAPRYGLPALVVVPLAVQLSFNNWWVVARGIRSLGCAPSTFLKLFFTIPWSIGIPPHAK